MRRIYLTCIIILLFSLTCSCAVINIPLFPSERPLQERVIGGEGKYKILIIDISGMISTEEKSGALGIGHEQNMVARIKEELELAGRDKLIKAVILKINSPGGTVTASDIIYHEIRTLKQNNGIKVVASLMELGTSGAYYIANSADKIIAHPTTITGSIGVIVLKLNFSGLMDKIGIKNETIKSGDKKDILLPLRAMSVDEKALMQQIIGQFKDRFIEVIKKGRPDIKENDLQLAADGRILSPQDALDLGLIDKIGYLDDAVDTAKELAGLDNARLIMYQPPSSYKSNIYAQAGKTAGFSLNPGQMNLSQFSAGIKPYFMYAWQPY